MNLSDLKDLLPAMIPSRSRVLVVHPQRFSEMQKLIALNTLEAVHLEFNMSVQIVTDPHVPLTQTRRVRRWLSKRERTKLYIRKYRKVEVEVLGYWLYPNEMKPVVLP